MPTMANEYLWRRFNFSLVEERHSDQSARLYNLRQADLLSGMEGVRYLYWRKKVVQKFRKVASWRVSKESMA